MKTSTRVVSGVVLFVAILALAGLFLQPNSISVIVSENTNSGHSATVSEAFSVCNDKRDAARLDGQDCEPCQLACPSGTFATGTHDYGDSVAYQGTYTGLSCETSSIGNLLRVTSYCNDRIRVCTEQVGIGEVIDRDSVSNGDVYLVEYDYRSINCDTKEPTGVTTSTRTYKLECDSGYTVNGRRISSSSGGVGSCVLIEDQVSDTSLSGTISQVEISDRVGTNDEVTVTGRFTAEADGRYHVYAEVLEGSRVPFSVAAASSGSDVCGNDASVAGVFEDMSAGDVLVFRLSMDAPSDEGTYSVQVASQNGCEGQIVDSTQGSVRIIGEQQQREEVIEEVITENPDLLDGISADYVDKYKELLAAESCADADLTVDGCAIATCSEDDEVVMLSQSEIESSCSEDEADIADKARKAAEKSSGDSLFSLASAQGKIFWALVAVIVIAAAALIFGQKEARKR